MASNNMAMGLMQPTPIYSAHAQRQQASENMGTTEKSSLDLQVPEYSLNDTEKESVRTSSHEHLKKVQTDATTYTTFEQASNGLLYHNGELVKQPAPTQVRVNGETCSRRDVV